MRTFPRCMAALLTALVSACGSLEERGTLAQLRHVTIDPREEKVEGGLARAMEGYQQFLSAAPESSMAPEAMRRLADLKIEKDYGPERPGATEPEKKRETEQTFVARATSPAAAGIPAETESSSAVEAIALYQQLLLKYPGYEHNDQVLYQMSRAYEEVGEVDKAMTVMNRLVAEYPASKYFDEVQFRRGEYFFTRKKYLDAEDAYTAIHDDKGESPYYELALYKLGWTLYKQELYEDGLQKFIALLDHKFSTGFDFAHITDDIERKRIEDTYRVISYSFSYLGGSDAATAYFAKYGHRAYEANIYANLGEHYLEKRRYHDAAASYKAFVALYPFHTASPGFDMRVIDIYQQGGFPRLVLASNKEFAKRYGLKAEYWRHFDTTAYPEVLGYLKKSLSDLASYYHAQYQDKQQREHQEENLQEAMTWYREFLDSFPGEADSAAMNYRLADLLLEHKDFAPAAAEYERAAYTYPPHDKAAEAGYAAVYAWREQLKTAASEDKDRVRRDIVRSSLKFVGTFPDHEKAALVLGAAADDLYELKDYASAEATGRRVAEQFPKADTAVLRSARLVVAHALFELGQYAEAEQAYVDVLNKTAEHDDSRTALAENLAASIYKQGEQASAAGDYRAAATHFLRIAERAPDSQIRPGAEFDGAVALIEIKDWDGAANVLQSFRSRYPDHKLQPEVTKKIALVYKEAGKTELAAAEYERIAAESDSDELRRGALLLAAELHTQGGEPRESLTVYQRYLESFPHPLEQALEVRHTMADLYQSLGDSTSHHRQLKAIADADAAGGSERTERTKYLAANAALALTEPLYERFSEVRLVQPFEANLQKKKKAMKEALDGFARLTGYEVGEVTAAATYYMAEIYYGFNRALIESERPAEMGAADREQYELALEEQAYPFEEKAIAVHQKNAELVRVGIYNAWVDKSLSKLAALMPARYAKSEESSGYIESIGSYTYEFVRRAVPETPNGPA